MLFEEIKDYTFHNIKKLKDFTNVERENLDFNFNVLQFVWAVIDKMKTYDLGFQNILKPTFRVYESSLGKTEFSNCQLKDFEFQYNTTNFYDCIFLGTEIPEYNLRILNGKSELIDVTNANKLIKEEVYTQKSDFYNQFKKIFEKQGNSFGAGIYNAKWSENQEKLLLLKINKDEKYLYSKYDLISFFKSFALLFSMSKSNIEQDIFTFNLNRISNKHGESWSKALIFIFCPTIMLFFLMVVSCYYDFITISEFTNSKVNFKYDNNLWPIIKYHLKDLPAFFNPARKLDFFEPLNGAGSLDLLTNFLDFISRIILAFGIYQLVVAFRKNSKKQ